MIKGWFFLFLIVINLVSITPIQAKTEECAVKPSYNIVVGRNFVQLVNDKTHLMIKQTGEIIFNNQLITSSATTRQDALMLQSYLREQLPSFVILANNQLDGIRNAFEVAIREKLGNKSDLLSNLNNLYSQLQALLKDAITTTDGITYFYYQPFNNLKKDGEAIGKKVFYSIVGDSIIHFNFFKNYSAIKEIAKQEWKEQKVILKSFDEHVCQLTTEIDKQYQQVMLELH